MLTTHVKDDGLKCVKDISPDFDITKVDKLEFGIENLEKRCCSFSVAYDCLVKNGKAKCPAEGDDKYSDLETILNNYILCRTFIIVFVGDSLTQGWLLFGQYVWAKHYVPRNANNCEHKGGRGLRFPKKCELSRIQSVEQWVHSLLPHLIPQLIEVYAVRGIQVCVLFVVTIEKV
ncbi:unnamed protein product [Oppiella nova]|uniref:Uncharacterized protein n=1 Tax=Oppiella nova TaxID=334625 RepID=A0A7R9QL38_9ACAR|nr:unnamed protein product [Oppiella nova]CAG2167766.1 unnamed protein product [Oppiella nova]